MNPGKMKGVPNPLLITGSRIFGLEADSGDVLEQSELLPKAVNRPELHSQGRDFS